MPYTLACDSRWKLRPDALLDYYLPLRHDMALTSRGLGDKVAIIVSSSSCQHLNMSSWVATSFSVDDLPDGTLAS